MGLTIIGIAWCICTSSARITCTFCGTCCIIYSGGGLVGARGADRTRGEGHGVARVRRGQGRHRGALVEVGERGGVPHRGFSARTI